MSDEPKIEERENGPLVATNITEVVGADGTIETRQVMALCRCGASQNKPFCDGSHSEIGFESRGGTPEGPDRLMTYKGAEINIHYNPLLCSHAAECVRLAGSVFDPARKPWVQLDHGTKADIEAVLAACPSGALSVAAEAGPEHLAIDRAQIVVEEHGPYWVKDVPAPTEERSEGAAESKYVLCRCGHSGNKPYCDGSHRSAKWRDAE